MNKQLEKVSHEFEQSAFWNLLGLELNELKEGFAKITLPIQPSFINVKKSVHGGIYTSVLDTTMGIAARSLGFDEVVTLQMNIQFLQSIDNGVMYSEASVLKRTRSTALMEGKLFDKEDNLIAHCTGTFKISKVDKP